jgi:hypothetical protein
MMSRVFLAAGVAALAIAAPASAGPHGHGGGGGHAAMNMRGGGGSAPQRQQAQRPQRAARQMAPQRAQRQMFAAQRQERAYARPQRVQMAQNRAAERRQMRVERQHVRPQHVQQVQNRAAQRQQMRVAHQQARPQHIQQAQNRAVQRQQMRGNRIEQVQNRMAQQQQVRGNRMQQVQNRMADRQQFRFERAHQAELQALRSADARVFDRSRIHLLAPRTRILAPAEAVRYVGAPLSTVTNYVPLVALPQSVAYLYPESPDYYYRYGDGYLYQVDRGSNLIAALLPLLAGGYMPGTYLPSAYMSSYVPNYYGLNSFYPASYGAGYGFGYDNLCNRYANGVVYQVDCITGMVENVVPMYAGGYGVGQMIPSAYSYYNVPMQYRSMYYPTADTSYWYAPGAIYQYDRSSSLITSVAALMSPGFTVGQPLPAGYGMYNVPLAYRSTYYDTPDAWYRYNNGYIYRVDPTTQLVSAVVASLLT